MRIIKNKKGEGEGILPGETVKIIIAVIGILALFYLAVSLYGIFNNKTEIEQAKASLDEIIQRVTSLPDGQSGNVLINSPNGWYLVYYDYALVASDSKKDIPKSCNSKDCLCICESGKEIEYQQPLSEARGGWPDYFYYRNAIGGELDGVTECENKGICSNVKEIYIAETRNYMVWAGILQKPESGLVNWISLSKLPKSLTLEKKDNKIKISEDSNAK